MEKEELLKAYKKTNNPFVMKKCNCTIPNKRIKVSENGITSYCFDCAKSLDNE